MGNDSAAVVAALAAAVDAVLDLDPSELADALIGPLVLDLVRQQRRLAKGVAEVVAVFDARGLCRADGARTTTAWLRHQLNLSPGDAAAEVRAARTVRELPATAAAFGRGETSGRHLDLIGRMLRKHGTIELIKAEPTLLPLAATAPPAELAIALERMDEALDPDGATAAEMERRAKRHLSIVDTYDGMAVMTAVLHREDAEVARAVLIPLATPVPLPDGSPDPRSGGERMADAFTDAFTRLLDTGTLPEQGGQKPHVTLVVPVQALLAEADSKLTALWGASLGTEAVRRVCCDAAVSVVVTGGDGATLDPRDYTDAQGRFCGLGLPLASGQAVRTATPAQRRALVVRDGGCAFPTCDRPPAFTDAHHILFWTHGGPTELGNLILLCRRRHRAVHEDNWTIKQDPQRPGLFQFHNPRGGPPLPAQHSVDRNPGSRLPLSWLDDGLDDAREEWVADACPASVRAG